MKTFRRVLAAVCLLGLCETSFVVIPQGKVGWAGCTNMKPAPRQCGAREPRGAVVGRIMGSSRGENRARPSWALPYKMRADASCGGDVYAGRFRYLDGRPEGTCRACADGKGEAGKEAAVPQGYSSLSGDGGDGGDLKPKGRLPLLKEVDSLAAMFDLVREDAGELTPREASIAMNHLSRLSRGSTASKRERAEVAGHLARLSGIAAEGVASFESKHVAWSLNAARQLAGREDAEALFLASLPRLDVLHAHDFGAQNLALTLNALSSFSSGSSRLRAALGRMEGRLLALVVAVPTAELSSWQAVSSIVNAAVNLGWSNGSVTALFEHMRAAIVGVLPLGEASPQSIAMIANGCANANYRDADVMAKLCMALESQLGMADEGPRCGLNAQGVGMLVNSLYRLKDNDEAFLGHICEFAKRLPASSYGPHSLALVMNGLSGLGWMDDELMRRLEESTMLLAADTPGLTGQQLANIVNAYARFGFRDEKIFMHLASLIESLLRSGKAKFKDVEVASVCNAFSRITLASFESAIERNDGAGNRQLVMTERLMMLFADAACELQELGIRPAASMLNAFSKLGLRHDRSIEVVSSVVCAASAGDIALADAVQMYHAAASLNYRSECMQRVLAGVIARALPGDFSLQSLGNAAWAAATMDEQQQELHEVLGRAIEARFEELMVGKEVVFNRLGVEGFSEGGDGALHRAVTYMDLQELRQVHQYLLTRRIGGFEVDARRAEVCRRVFEARSRNRAAPSQFQDRVVAAFAELGCKVEAEHIEKKSGYSIDIIITVPGHWRTGGGEDLLCAVEVDGPAHFAGPDHTLGQILGKTSLKRRHLGLLGWPLITVPFYEWNAVMRGREARWHYISEKLTAALGEGILVDCHLI